MFNFEDKESQKRYGRIKRGWHTGRIHNLGRKNRRSKVPRQYIKVDFEIIQESEYKNILVPGFFNYNKNWKPDPRFLEMGKAAGLKGNYGEDIDQVLRDLLGKELKIYVVHRFKNGQRRERAEDFRPLPTS